MEDSESIWDDCVGCCAYHKDPDCFNNHCFVGGYPFNETIEWPCLKCIVKAICDESCDILDIYMGD